MPTVPQYMWACRHVSDSTGKLAPRNMDGLRPETFSNAACVASVLPIQKPLVIVTWCAGCSLGRQVGSPGEQPIVKLPGAIQTYSRPSCGLIFVLGSTE